MLIKSKKPPNSTKRLAEVWYSKMASRHCLRFSVVMTLALVGLGGTPSPAIPQDASLSLPSLRLVRTLPAPNLFSTFGMFQSGTSRLTWSPDGERLAVYIRDGLAIMVWSPDGKVRYEYPRYGPSVGTSYILHFLSGHAKLIAGPKAETEGRDDLLKVYDVAFSVLDAETGKVLRNIPGPNLGKPPQFNTVREMAIAPDERFAAVVYSEATDGTGNIGIYSIDDWQRIATIERPRDPWNKVPGAGAGSPPRRIVFSPNGQLLAVLDGLHGRVLLYETGSWRLVQSFETFPDPWPPLHVVSPSALAFSPDGSMIAVGSFGGGSWWEYPDKKPAPKGVGTLTETFPAEPLRVFKVADGSRVASLGGFPGGFLYNSLLWPAKGNYIAFLDGIDDIRFWNPLGPGVSIEAASMGQDAHAGDLVMSPDGSQFAVNFVTGVKIFDIISNEPGGRP